MKEQPAYAHRAEAWLAGQMTPLELRQFEQERRENPELEAHCQFLLHLSHAQEEAREATFKSTLQGIESALQTEGFFEEKTQPTPMRASFVRRRTLAYAAAVLVIVAAIGWWSLAQRQAADTARQQAQIALHNTPFPYKTPDARLGMLASNRDTLLILAQSGQYLAAAEGWRKAYERASGDPQVRYYWALCQMKSVQQDPQHPPLQLLKSLQREYKQDPEGLASILQPEDLYWYLALSYLVEGQPSAAKPLLQQLAKMGGERQQEAAVLLGQIR